MNIQSLKFISESSQCIIYQVDYINKGNWFERSERKTIQVFIKKYNDSVFSPFVKDYNTGKTIDSVGHLYNAILHDYELNAKKITFEVKGSELVGKINKQ